MHCSYSVVILFYWNAVFVLWFGFWMLFFAAIEGLIGNRACITRTRGVWIWNVTMVMCNQNGNVVPKCWITVWLKLYCYCWLEHCFNYFWQSILVIEFLVFWYVFNLGEYFVNLLCFVCWYANGLCRTHLFWMILFSDALFTWLWWRVIGNRSCDCGVV